jgi:hypothetical protein
MDSRLLRITECRRMAVAGGSAVVAVSSCFGRCGQGGEGPDVGGRGQLLFFTSRCMTTKLS